MVDEKLVENVPVLSALSETARKDLAEVAREVRYRADERIVALLKPPTELIMVLEGLAKLTGVAFNGLERIIYVYRPGDIIGSRVLLEESPESSYEVIAMREVHGLAISGRDFLALGRRHPDLLVAVTGAFTRRLDYMARRVLAATSVEVPVRLSQLLLDFRGAPSDGDQGFVPLAYSLTHETMAQIIGASRPHTSTVLRDLEHVGAVRRRSGKGLLVNPQRLNEIVSEEAVVQSNGAVGITMARRSGSGSSPSPA